MVTSDKVSKELDELLKNLTERNITKAIKIIKKHKIVLTKEQTELLFKKWDEEKQKGVPLEQIASRTLLIAANERLIYDTLHNDFHFYNSNLLFEEYYLAGLTGLMIAVDNFDPSKGFKISSYAKEIIKNEIIADLKEKKRSINALSFEDKAFSNSGNNIESITIADTVSDNDQQFYLADFDLEAIQKEMKYLKFSHQLLLNLLAGLNGYPALDPVRIAELLHVSRQNVSVMLSTALKKLKVLLTDYDRLSDSEKKVYKSLKNNCYGLLSSNECQQILLDLQNGKKFNANDIDNKTVYKDKKSDLMNFNSQDIEQVLKYFNPQNQILLNLYLGLNDCPNLRQVDIVNLFHYSEGYISNKFSQLIKNLKILLTPYESLTDSDKLICDQLKANNYGCLTPKECKQMLIDLQNGNKIIKSDDNSKDKKKVYKKFGRVFNDAELENLRRAMKHINLKNQFILNLDMGINGCPVLKKTEIANLLQCDVSSISRTLSSCYNKIRVLTTEYDKLSEDSKRFYKQLQIENYRLLSSEECRRMLNDLQYRDSILTSEKGQILSLSINPQNVGKVIKHFKPKHQFMINLNLGINGCPKLSQGEIGSLMHCSTQNINKMLSKCYIDMQILLTDYDKLSDSDKEICDKLKLKFYGILTPKDCNRMLSDLQNGKEIVNFDEKALYTFEDDELERIRLVMKYVKPKYQMIMNLDLGINGCPKLTQEAIAGLMEFDQSSISKILMICYSKMQILLTDYDKLNKADQEVYNRLKEKDYGCLTPEDCKRILNDLYNGREVAEIGIIKKDENAKYEIVKQTLENLEPTKFRQVMRHFKPKYQLMISLERGMNNCPKLTQEAIAGLMKYSVSNICKILSRCYDKIRILMTNYDELSDSDKKIYARLVEKDYGCLTPKDCEDMLNELQNGARVLTVENENFALFGNDLEKISNAMKYLKPKNQLIMNLNLGINDCPKLTQVQISKLMQCTTGNINFILLNCYEAMQILLTEYDELNGTGKQMYDRLTSKVYDCLTPEDCKKMLSDLQNGSGIEQLEESKNHNDLKPKVDDKTFEGDDLEKIRQGMKHIKPKFQLIMNLDMGINGCAKLKQIEIARLIHTSQSNISVILSKCYSRMRILLSKYDELNNFEKKVYDKLKTKIYGLLSSEDCKRMIDEFQSDKNGAAFQSE